MNEVEKMYENANIKPDCTYLFLVDGNGENEAARTISIGNKADLKRLIVDCGVKGKVIKSTNTLKPFYPLFTAEKQIKIIEWLGNSKAFFDANGTIFSLITNHKDKNGVVRGYEGKGNSVDSCLASLINKLWQDLTDAEKAQIKEILE